MAVLSDPKARRRCAYLFAMAIAAQLEAACADPPTDLEAGRLLTLPGDAAGAALVSSGTNGPPPQPDAASPANEPSDSDASSTDETDAASANGGSGP